MLEQILASEKRSSVNLFSFVQQSKSKSKFVVELPDQEFELIEMKSISFRILLVLVDYWQWEIDSSYLGEEVEVLSLLLERPFD